MPTPTPENPLIWSSETLATRLLTALGAAHPEEYSGLDPWWWTRGWWLRRDGQGSGQGGFVGEWGLVTAG